MKAGLAWFWLVIVAACLYLAINAEPPGTSKTDSATRELKIPSEALGSFSPELRVSLTDTPARELRLAIDGPYRFVPAGSQQYLAGGEKLAETTVSATENGIRIGDREYPTTRLEIDVEQSPSIWVGDHLYRGRVRFLRQPRGRILAVNVVSLEEYVASVLDGEMPADFPPAARQAQAIVARTYALYQVQESRDHPHFDLFASTRSQKYLGAQYRDARGRRLAGESDSSRKAAAETAGMVCTYQGRVFSTYYTAACGGRTIEGREVFRDAAPPLTSINCDWCRDCKFYQWRIEVGRTELEEALRRCFASQKQPFDELTSISVSRNSPVDGVPVLSVRDGRRQLTVSAADLRRELSSSNLPSPLFLISDGGNVVYFEGRGHGHGVGFCQWGARGQALAGRTALEIVRYYYRGASVVRLEGAK